MGNFIWWRKIIYALFSNIEKRTQSETLEKKTNLLHGNKLDEKIQVDQFSKLKES